jgi:hypothetical protein
MPLVTVEPLQALTASCWDFRSGTASWAHPVFGGARATWDPFPAYAHDATAARAAAHHVQSVCPPPWPVTVYLADREETARTNGFSYTHDTGGHFDDTGWVKDSPAGLIMLPGKRVPPHPAVTAYVIAHEYGHQVECMVNYAAGRPQLHDPAAAEGYRLLRGLPETARHRGSGGTWHDSVHEIMACDFRIMACGIEEAYWPHPGVPRPESVPGLDEWWENTLISIEHAITAAAVTV